MRCIVLVCPNLEGCSFVNDIEKNTKQIIDYYKKKYCEGAYEKCARYIVSITDKEVPEDLKPE